MIVDKINAYLSSKEKIDDDSLRREVEKLAGHAFKRQFMTEDESDSKGVIRMSSIGRCVRQVAYGYHGIEKSGKELDARAKIVFWMGDLTELTVIALAKLAGCNIAATGMNQLQVKFNLNGSVITGHPDGVLFADKSQFLVEVKSMSSYSFEKFEKGFVDDAYVAQYNAYMEALGLAAVVYVALNKDSGVMSERVFYKDNAIVEQIRKNVLDIAHSTKNSLPDPAFVADAKGIFPWQCLYCSWHKVCKPNAEKVLIKSSYKLKQKEAVVV